MSNTRFVLPLCVASGDCKSTIVPLTVKRNGGFNLWWRVRDIETQQAEGGREKVIVVRLAAVGFSKTEIIVPRSLPVCDTDVKVL